MATTTEYAILIGLFSLEKIGGRDYDMLRIYPKAKRLEYILKDEHGALSVVHSCDLASAETHNCITETY